MAANYWTSTQHRHWTFSKDQLAAKRKKLELENVQLHQMFPLPGLRELSMYLHSQINRLAKRLGLHQQPVATAQVFIKRFYTRIEIRRTNPYLVLLTAIYLACKTEECPQHIRVVLNEAKTLWPDMVTLDVNRVGEYEFFLISEMRSQLVVHQPYRALSTLKSDLGLPSEVSEMALAVINDHYLTDLPLLYPPHIIAMAAISLAMTPSLPDTAVEEEGPMLLAGGPIDGRTSPARDHRAAMTASPLPPGSLQPAPGTKAAAPAPGPGPVAEDAMPSFASMFTDFLASSDVDMEAIVDCMQQMISLYECQARHNNKSTQEQIHHFIKSQGLDK